MKSERQCSVHYKYNSNCFCHITPCPTLTVQITMITTMWREKKQQQQTTTATSVSWFQQKAYISLSRSTLSRHPRYFDYCCSVRNKISINLQHFVIIQKFIAWKQTKTFRFPWQCSAVAMKGKWSEAKRTEVKSQLQMPKSFAATKWNVWLQKWKSSASCTRSTLRLNKIIITIKKNSSMCRARAIVRELKSWV